MCHQAKMSRMIRLTTTSQHSPSHSNPSFGDFEQDRPLFLCKSLLKKLWPWDRNSEIQLWRFAHSLGVSAGKVETCKQMRSHIMAHMSQTLCFHLQQQSVGMSCDPEVVYFGNDLGENVNDDNMNLHNSHVDAALVWNKTSANGSLGWNGLIFNDETRAIMIRCFHKVIKDMKKLQEKGLFMFDSMIIREGKYSLMYRLQVEDVTLDVHFALKIGPTQLRFLTHEAEWGRMHYLDNMMVPKIDLSNKPLFFANMVRVMKLLVQVYWNDGPLVSSFPEFNLKSRVCYEIVLKCWTKFSSQWKDVSTGFHIIIKTCFTILLECLSTGLIPFLGGKDDDLLHVFRHNRPNEQELMLRQELSLPNGLESWLQQMISLSKEKLYGALISALGQVQNPPTNNIVLSEIDVPEIPLTTSIENVVAQIKRPN